MKEHIFVIGFVFLLLFSSVAPLSIGYDVKISNINKISLINSQQFSTNLFNQKFVNELSLNEQVDNKLWNALTNIEPLPWWDGWLDFPGRYEPFFEVHDIKDFGQAAWGMTSEDFNKDGKLDFAVSWATSPWTQSTISIMYSDGKGGFTQDDVYIITSPLYRYFSDLNSGDYDNDGDIDLLFAYDDKETNIGTVCLFFNDGNNQFENATIITVLLPTGNPGRENPNLCSADFDNDDDIDFLVGDNTGLVEFYKNDGTGTFTRATIYDFGGKMSWGLSSADFNNDGNIDFIVTLLTSWPSPDVGCIYLIRNDGTPSCFNQFNFVKIADIPPLSSFFTNIILGFGCLCAIDYNNDGLMDFVFAGSDSVFLYMQNETGVFDYFHLMNLPMQKSEEVGWYIDDLRHGGITVGDFNKDGLDDMVIGGVQGFARICYNKFVLADIIRPDNPALFIDNIKQFEPIPIYSFIKNGISVVVGHLTVEVKPLVPLQKVEFYLGNRLMYTDVTAPYEWKWTGFSFGRQKIKAVPYDMNSEQAGFDDAIVWKLF